MDQVAFSNKIPVFPALFHAVVRLLPWGVLMAFLTGCATTPVSVEGVYSRLSGRPLHDAEPWSLQGRLFISDSSDSWQADVDWEHQPGIEQIKLSGPMGQGAVVIHLTKDFVTVARGADEVESSGQPEQFIRQQLGVFVPVRALRYWVLGLPMPGSAFEDVPDGFRQEGWQVDYPEMQSVAGLLMPRKIAAKNEYVKLKLMIDQWIINGNEE
ncbi:MAG: lipoprotein insertase outer membrane protein LolB [Gammaproteobacteria bacterium]